MLLGLLPSRATALTTEWSGGVTLQSTPSMGWGWFQNVLAFRLFQCYIISMTNAPRLPFTFLSCRGDFVELDLAGDLTATAAVAFNAAEPDPGNRVEVARAERVALAVEQAWHLARR